MYKIEHDQTAGHDFSFPLPLYILDTFLFVELLPLFWETKVISWNVKMIDNFVQNYFNASAA